MSFLSELRRRSVFKVGAAYAIVAWLLLQISDVVLPTFNTPQWVLQTITFLLILGLPVALILAWAFDLTPEGIKTAAEVDSAAPVAASAGPNINTALLALLVLAVGFMAVDQYVLEGGAPLPAVDPTSAVAENLSGDALLASSAGSTTATQRSSFDIGGTIPMGATAAIEAEPTISRDGRRLVFSANRGNGIQLHSRLLDDFDSLPIPDISPARVPFMSPDGLWVGYGSSITSLSKVSIRGGRPQVLTDEIGLFFGGSWGDDGTIIFSTSDEAGSYLASIPAAGGAVERLTTPEPGGSHRWPEILPGGREVLFTIGREGRPAREGSIAVLSLETNDYRMLIPNAFNARYVPTGHIVFARETGLWAVPFQLEGMDIRGEPTPVIYDVQLNTESGHAPYGFSDNGALVYVRGADQSAAGLRDLLWIDRTGQETPIDIPAQNFFYPDLSPEGSRLAISHGSDFTDLNVWIYDLELGTQNPLTFGAGTGDIYPLWTPDGQNVVYYSVRDEGGIFIKAADGTGQEERLSTSQISQRPSSFSPDGAYLVYEQGALTESNIHILSLEGDRESRPLLNETFDERSGVVSPDGRYIAYDSLETGDSRVYVSPFPNVEGGKWLVANTNSWAPVWRADGKELLFRVDSAVFGSVEIISVDPFVTGQPEILEIEIPVYVLGATSPNFDVTPDGQRILAMRNALLDEVEENRTSIAIVNNWFAELSRLVPPEP